MLVSSHLQIYECEKYDFTCAVLSKSKGYHSCHTCVDRVALVSHLCCTCVAHVSLVLHLCRSCRISVARAALVSLVSGTCVVN